MVNQNLGKSKKFKNNLGKKLSKKIALVTGNFKGLGKAISEKLVEIGYATPLVVRSKDFDLTKVVDCQKLVNSVLEKYGKLDLLINNVGDYERGYVDDFSIESWQHMINSNLNSAFYLSKFALASLRETKGKIINIGFCGLEKLSPPPAVFAYQVAKTGLLTLTKAMAKAEAVSGLTVNMISPGSMENTVEHDSELVRIPMGRFAKLEEVVNVVEFVLANDYLTGQNIEVAGGRAL